MALAQFDYARKRASQDAEAANQQQNDALKRRFAAQGGLNSGAYVKQQQVAADQGAVRKENAMQGIDAQEQQEVQRQKEVQEGRAFQTSERLGSQGFMSGESALQRRFATDERLGSQGFANEQRLGSQQFAANESALSRALQDSQWTKTYGMQKEQNDRSYQLANDQFGLAKDQYDLDERTTILNAGIAAAEADDSASVQEWIDQMNRYYANRKNNPGGSVTGAPAGNGSSRPGYGTPGIKGLG